MATRAVYKIWQLVPKFHIMASVHRRLSQSSCPLLKLLGPTPKLIYLFFELGKLSSSGYFDHLPIGL